jgi:hypothetical protein
VGHRESHKSIAAAETHPIDSDSNQKSRDDGFANEHSQKRLNSKHPSNLYGREGRQWKDRLSELADYRKIHGHCNVPDTHSENLKLGIWVRTQRQQYRLHHVEGKTPPMSNFRIQELEGIGFKWKVGGDGRQWEDRLTIARSTGTAMFLKAGAAKTQSWLIGLVSKGNNTGCTWKERYRN